MIRDFLRKYSSIFSMLAISIAYLSGYFVAMAGVETVAEALSSSAYLVGMAGMFVAGFIVPK